MSRVRVCSVVSLASLLLIGCAGVTEDAGGDGSPATLGSGWPQWGGARGDFRVDGADLTGSWADGGPYRLWQRDLGPGYSAIAGNDNRIYTMYREAEQDVVIALDPETGDKVWEFRYPGRTYEGNILQFGSGPNASPLVLEDRVITLGYGGMLHGLDPETGDRLWSHDLISGFGGTILEFGYSASPVLIDGLVIVPVGGKQHSVVAFAASDGSVVWASPPGSVSYATPILIEVEGQPQIVYFSADEVIGIDPGDGARLWSHPCENQYRNNATPPQWDERSGLLWAATQLDGGTRALKLSLVEGGTEVEEVWFNEEISIHFWNSTRIDDHVYASIGGQGSRFSAIELATGEIKWSEDGYSKVNAINTGDQLIFLDEGGHLGIARVSPDGFELLAETRISEDTTWTVPTLIGSRLYVRDTRRIMAFELGQPESVR